MTVHRTLGRLGIAAFEGRGISAETAVRFGIYTASRQANGLVEPDVDGKIVVFPFEERGAIVNEKYRAPGKQFSQRKGGRRTFWNADALDDPALADGYMALIITEGEIDALTAIDCGFPLTVSVPDGAPPVPTGEAPGELKPIDPDKEGAGKFEFLWNNRERLKAVKRFIIASDNDAPGQRLAAELVRRLSAARCMFVTYPDGCKDLNDVLVKHGPEEVTSVLNGARPYPVRGLYRLGDYPDLPELQTYSTGWETLSDLKRPLLRLFAGEFMVVAGIPGHGKSSWVLNLALNLAEVYAWKAALFSPEMPTVPHLRDKLRRIRMRARPTDLEWEKTAHTDAWLNDRLLFIDSDPTGRNDEEFDLDWVLDRATDAVLRDGIRLLVIDPWNEIEHAKRNGESMSEYVGRSIRAIKRFAQLYEVAVIVVVHPTKEVGRDGKSRPVTLYDIADSAHWFNKCDHGIVVDRPDANLDESVIRVAKARFEESGEKGSVRLKYDRESCRFSLLDETNHSDANAF